MTPTHAFHYSQSSTPPISRCVWDSGQEAADDNKKECLLSIYSVPGNVSDGFTLEYKLHEGKDFFFCVGLCCLLKQCLAHKQCCYICCVNEENETCKRYSHAPVL